MNDREVAGTNDKTGGTPRQEEATSSETLGDLEGDEASVASSPAGDPSSSAGSASNDQGAADASTPSPDGAFDSPRGGDDDAGGPM